jgi:hypothetical protein
MFNLHSRRLPALQSPALHYSGDREISIPQITIKTGFMGPDGLEEQLTEYICDHPGCPNIAIHVLVVAELRLRALVCDEHLPGNNRH